MVSGRRGRGVHGARFHEGGGFAASDLEEFSRIALWLPEGGGFAACEHEEHRGFRCGFMLEADSRLFIMMN